MTRTEITVRTEETLNGTRQVSTRVRCKVCGFDSFCLRIGNAPPPVPRCPRCTRDNSFAGWLRRTWLHALSVATWFHRGEYWGGHRDTTREELGE